MTDRPSLVISDVHWGAIPAERERAFLAFLRSWRGSAREIFFNGDLFDFWFEYRTVVPAQAFPLLRVLAELTESGVRLALLGGNHDAWGGAFLREAIGVEVLEGPARREIAGWRVWLAHGDGLGQGDLGYRALKAVLRSRAAIGAFRWLHPDWAARLARAVSKTGRAGESERKRLEERAAALHAFARDLLSRDRSIDVVVLGHCHVPTLVEEEPGRYYVNAGDWVAHRSYAVLRPGHVEMKTAVDSR